MAGGSESARQSMEMLYAATDSECVRGIRISIADGYDSRINLCQMVLKYLILVVTRTYSAPTTNEKDQGLGASAKPTALTPD
jgi:hypothetical protein